MIMIMIRSTTYFFNKAMIRYDKFISYCLDVSFINVLLFFPYSNFIAINV